MIRHLISIAIFFSIVSCDIEPLPMGEDYVNCFVYSNYTCDQEVDGCTCGAYALELGSKGEPNTLVMYDYNIHSLVNIRDARDHLIECEVVECEGSRLEFYADLDREYYSIQIKIVTPQ